MRDLCGLVVGLAYTGSVTTNTPDVADELNELRGRIAALEDAVAGFGSSTLADSVKQAERDRATGKFGADSVPIPEAVDRYRRKRFDS